MFNYMGCVVVMMSILIITRETFLERYDNERTRDLIRYALRAWDGFLAERNVSEADLFLELRTPESKQRRYVMLDQFVQYLKKGRHPRSVRMYFQYVKAWLRQNEIEIEDWKVKTEIRFPKMQYERVRGIDCAMLRNLRENSTPMYRAVWDFLIYTGARDGSEALALEWGWIDFAVSPPKITIPAAHAKTRQERITFAGADSETWLRAQRKARALEPDGTKVFRVQKKDGTWRDITYDAAYQYFRRMRAKLGYTAKGSNGRYHFHPHAIRGFTLASISKAAGEEFAHALLGHKEKVGQYFAKGTTDETARQDYVSALPHLLLTEEGRLRDENKKLKDTIQKTDTIETEIERIKRFLARHPEFAKEFGK